MAGLLTQAGYEVVTVPNGDAQAIGRSRRCFDLLIVDSYPQSEQGQGRGQYAAALSWPAGPERR